MTAPEPPDEFDGYRLVELLGEGGMGRVYLAQDTLLDREVAIKLISGASSDALARERFYVEARAIARLQQPNVVSIYRVGEVEGCPYLVSELVRGTSLDRLGPPLPWQRALAIGLDLARGLAAAHRRGVVHRDVKPANAILSDEGVVKLLDFGIAKLVETDSTRLPAGPVGSADAEREAVDEPPVRAPDGAAPDETRPTVELPPATAPLGLEAALEPPAEAGDALERLTRPGTAIGTPSYMAPEVWRGEPATFASDVYSLGALLYYLCAGRPPHAARGLEALRARVVGTDARPLAELAPEVDPRFAAVVDRCLARDPAARYPGANEVRDALTELTPEGRGGALPEGNPYRGLLAFEARHRGLFFGRDSEIRGILERLVTEPLVVVAGDSGAGKSSLCAAGVLPRLEGWLGAERRWGAASVVPGAHPVTAFGLALVPHIGLEAEEVEALIVEDPGAVVRSLRRELGSGRGLVLFVDQLEELVTLGEPDEVEAVAQVLGWLSSPSPCVRVLAAVRGDFLGRVASLPPLEAALTRALYFLRPLSRERVREAIVAPARALGFEFETERLVDEMVGSTVGAGGGLPLLQFALAALWEERDRDRRLVTEEANARIGGVEGALSAHADEVLARMTPAKRALARRLLLELVTGDGTRARRPRDELVVGAPRAEAALDALVQGRLVVARDTAEGARYEIAHEALVTRWATLARWLGASAEARLATERLVRAAADWERHGRDRLLLWRAPQLAEVSEARLEEPDGAAAEFLRASRRGVRTRRFGLAVAALAVPLVLALVYGLTATAARRDLDRRVEESLAAARRAAGRAAALDREARARSAEAFALFDRPNLEAGEGVWSRAQAARGEVRGLLATAARHLETAVGLAPERADARSDLAAVLLSRALAAEEDGDRAAVDEHLARMAIYDDGEARRRWDEPARVTLEVEPAGASVVVERYMPDETGRLRLEAVPHEAPWRTARLEPGSYRATLSAPGRADVAAPFVARRGESVALEIALPARGQVPDGFAFVPAGTFLFGSRAPDDLRRGFYNAVPVHPVDTGPYLVGLREVTFGAWIEYLEALPDEERGRRAPRATKGGFEGALALEALPGGGYRLEIQPSSTRYAARGGEPIRYEGRSRRVEVDWLRLPVTGVTAEDAVAYAAWLDRSGRLPGARLCTEREWERAGRGADARHFPHGDRLDPDDANFDETHGRVPSAMGPDEVGSHPASRSPFGLDDMAGNAWEWTVSTLGEGHAARGGSFYYGRNAARLSNRETPEASFRDVSVGLRLCADPPR